MSNDLITVIIPVYNVEQYLDQCIKSVVTQTYKDLEIILVDDGSTDSSGSMCDLWQNKDTRIKVIHKTNGGLSSARNTGISIAKGKYIGFVDSDDWISSEMYEILHKLITTYDCQISVCGINRTDTIEKRMREKIINYSQKDYIKKILKVGTQESNQYAWNKLYVRDIISNDIYPEGLTDEDVEGTFKALLKCKNVVETTKKLYYYRIDNDKSITAPFFNERRLDYLTICDHVLELAYQSNDQQIIEWAQLFRSRADFGILSRIAVMEVSDGMKDKIDEIKKQLLSNLKGNYFLLMHADIPLSRKLLISAYCVNYDAFKKLLRLKEIKTK